MDLEDHQEFLEDLRKTCENGDFCDLTIVCGDDIYRTYKLIVCARSSFMAKAMKFPGKEAEEGKIDLSDNDAAIVKLLIQYFHESDYSPFSVVDKDKLISIHARKSRQGYQVAKHTCHEDRRCWKSKKGRVICQHHHCGIDCDIDCTLFICALCRDPNELMIHAQMYEIADKYDVRGLKGLATRKFNDACSCFWNHEKFAAAARYVFMSTPDGDRCLRNVILETLLENTELLSKPEIMSLLQKNNHLCYDVLREMVSTYCDD